MNIANPNNLFLLITLLPVILLLVLQGRRKAKRFSLYAEEHFLRQYLRAQSPFLIAVKTAMAVTALVFIILALARPQWDYQPSALESRSLDIMLCLDISPSMNAKDLSPTRLGRAKLHLEYFIDRLVGDRVGIIAFAGEPSVECPLTDDYAAARMILQSLSAESRVRRGTDLGAALGTALQTFENSGENNVLIMISDGEDLGSGARELARKLATAGVSVYILGVGTNEGAPITDDQTGESVITRLDQRYLESLARNAGGKYYTISSGQNDLEEILRYIYSTERKPGHKKNVNLLKEQFTIPALLALLLLLVEGMIVAKRRSRSES